MSINNNRLNHIGMIQPYSVRIDVYTPKVSPVKSIYDKDWNDVKAEYGQNAEAIIKHNQIEDFVNAYPNAILLRDYNIKYNCFSYAFYSTSIDNKIWILDPSPYMNDGSYIQSSCAIGRKVYYGNGQHAGIVVGAGSGYGGRVIVE